MIAVAVVRAIHFASLMAIFGASAYGTLLRVELGAEAPPRLRGLFAGAATLAFVTAIVWFGLIVAQMSGDWHGAFDPASLKAVATETRFGQIFLARVAGLATLWVVCLFRRPARSFAPALLAGILLCALGLTSHAAANSGHFPLLRAGNDAVHLLAGGFWLGSLLVLAMLVARDSNPAALLAPLRLFSDWGTWAVIALVLSGIVNAASILPRDFLSLPSAYADLLLAKVTLALAMIALASVNRWRVAASMQSGDANATRRLARNVGAEIVLGILIVSIAGTLGTLPPR